jgi:hypothetical protein
MEEVTNFDNTSVVSTRKVWWWKKPGTLKRYSIDLFDCSLSERDITNNQHT